MGNGARPISDPTQLGICKVAPLLPQPEQRTRWRSTSLDGSGLQRMITVRHGGSVQASPTRAVDPQPALDAGRLGAFHFPAACAAS